MKKFILILIAILEVTFNTFAQVGIGRVPHAGSILDLTNPDNKYILFPKASSTPSMVSLASPGSFIYYQGKFYLKTPVEVKILTPWQWDGSASGSIYSTAANPVGFGITPIIPSPYRLHVADASGSGVSLSGLSKASILIGDTASTHLAIDNNEVMAKTNASTAGTLKLQKEGGVVAIGMSATVTTNTALEVNGSIDAANQGKIKENGNDLIPVGMIIMWKGTVVPQGWALCDGGTYTTMAGGSITTPDLRERFIVGAGGPGYIIAAVGGTISSTHTHDIDLPANTATVPDGAHQHSGTTGTYTGSTDNTSGGGPQTAETGHTHSFTTDIGGAHVHTIDVASTTTDVPTVTENRPPYYALLFIMKL